MGKLTKKPGKKTRRRVFLIFILTVFLFVVIISSTVKIWFQINDENKDRRTLEKQLAKLQDDESYLKEEVQKLQDPDYVARYAREKYLYSKNGEFTIKIP